MGWFKTYSQHKLVAQPIISLGLTALSLLLLVLVLLSVPGPIKGLYWFSVKAEGSSDGPLSAGVLGWCIQNTSNCTYAPLSDNAYLSTLIDVGEALTVRITLPLACYWMILTVLLWVTLTVLCPLGYRIKDLDSITRHLRFAVIEACVLCASLFANVLCWLAFGLGRNAYLSIQSKGGAPKSGHAMETTAVAATISLLSLFTASWSLHLRLRQAQENWREQAVMVRRRSMALSAAGASTLAAQLGGSIDGGNQGQGYLPNGVNGDLKRSSRIDEKPARWSDSPEPYGATGVGVGGGGVGYRGSMVKVYDDGQGSYGNSGYVSSQEEMLDIELEKAKRNSRDIRRTSSLSHVDSPYAAAAAATTTIPPSNNETQ